MRKLVLQLREPRALVELFALVNLAFLAVDIWFAHSYNDFHDPAEWIPFVVSTAGPFLLVVGIAVSRSLRPNATTTSRILGFIVGGTGVVTGITGLLLHLRDTFFIEQTLENLVYTAPFAAPLAYSGIGMLLIMNRMVEPRSREWAQWTIFLAFGGFVGNFVLTLADHAQNGFFDPKEWIAVVAAALAVGTLLLALWDHSRQFLIFASAMLAFQCLIGFVGFILHFLAIRSGPMATLMENSIFGTPMFAPLLFVNLALLGAIGIYALWCHDLIEGPARTVASSVDLGK